MVDGLVELLLHRITVKAERRVDEELVEEAREVRGKARILFRVAEAAVDQPDGVVRDVIFPVQVLSTLCCLRGPSYERAGSARKRSSAEGVGCAGSPRLMSPSSLSDLRRRREMCAGNACAPGSAC